MILDLFAGPGGWDEGLRLLGRTDVIGVEWDADACATAEAAGHERIQRDVRSFKAVTAETFPEVTGLIASPPCPNFSAAGLGKGRDDMPALLAVSTVRSADELAAFTASLQVDEQSALALEPLRFALGLRPAWIAWEQVPEVLPLWKACAPVLRSVGYSVDCAVLKASDHGVPQARSRAFLVARTEKPWAALPAPTRRPVSMSAALGWAASDLIGFPRRADKPTGTVELGGVAYRARDLFPASRPAPTLTEKARSWRRWSAGEPTAITIAEASVLQGFPADYPWQGSRSSQFHQIGNAVPPPLAADVLQAVGAAQQEVSA